MVWWMWLAGGLVLLVFELVTPSGFFVMFFGISALAVGVLARLGLASPPLQWLLFTVLSIAGLVLFCRRLQAYADHQPEGPPVDSLIGALATPVVAIPPGKVGKVEVRGTQWTARNEATVTVEAGQRCRVARVDGLELGIAPEEGA